MSFYYLFVQRVVKVMQVSECTQAVVHLATQCHLVIL